MEHEAQAQTAEPAALVADLEHRYDPFPLTKMERAYWLGRDPSLELGGIGIHLYEEVDCADLDLERLQRAWQRVLDRHDMLRAVVLPDGRQQVLRQASYRIPVVDLRGRSSAAKAAQLDALRARLSHQVYDPTVWPPFEFLACRLDRHRIRLCLSLDALHIDMASLTVLLEDWARFYDDPEAPVEPLALSFRDYVLALEEWRETKEFERSLAYWQERAGRLPPAPQLPRRRPPETRDRPRFVRRRGSLAADAWQRLKDRAARLGLTPSGLLLAVYAEVLVLWNQDPELTINVPLFNPQAVHSDLKQVVGNYTSTLLLEVRHSPDLTFAARAARLQEQFWQDLEHRTVSGIEVLREVARTRGKVSDQILMPVVYTSLLGGRTRGLLVLKRFGERVYNVMQTPQVILDLHVQEEEGELYFDWDAVEQSFPAGLMDEMYASYGSYLKYLAEGEEAWGRRERAPLPSAQLRQRAQVNATEQPVPDVTVGALIKEQAQRQGLYSAVITSSRTLTYEELNHRSSVLCSELRQLGVSRDQLVAIVMEKGWEQVVGVLAILQAGGAYLPIDPALPRERLLHLLYHGQVAVALTQSWIEPQVKWLDNVRRLCLDQHTGWGDGASPAGPGPTPHDLAYVMYTSGSTGLPKGVMIEHHSVVNRIVDVNQRFGVGPEDRIFGLTALHHDLSVYDICGVLATGACIVLPDAGRLRDPQHWAELLLRERVTVWNSVPAFLEMLVAYLEQAGDRVACSEFSLRLVLLSGDWIPVTLPDRIRRLFAGAQVVSLGGPTETTIWDICYPISDITSSWPSIPYGRPMANARYHILNPALEPCPVWAPGELFIGGSGLARGYWRDEEQTRARFLRHPQTGERLYRSGDRGRYLPDGTIEFLGRQDFQLKVGGHRIEAGEVEETIKQHPQVAAVVVTTDTESGRARQLIAYVVPKERQASGKFRLPDGTVTHEQGYDPLRARLTSEDARVFVLSQPGLRADLDGHRVVRLSLREPGEALVRTYVRRRTWRRFLPEPIPLSQFSQLLSCLRGVAFANLPVPKYRYPSAGNLHPVQTYVAVKAGRVEGCLAGTYYYHPGEHCLFLLTTATLPRGIHVPHNISIYEESAFSLFFIGQLSAVDPLYGTLARDLCLIESGAMIQLLMTEALDCQIGLCPVGDLDFAQIQDAFRLEPSHTYLHSLLGGRISPEQAAAQISLPEIGGATSLNPVGRDKVLANELGDLLKERLPGYMIPSRFVLLDSLPLSPNGKVDRRALPMWDLRRGDSGPVTEPRSALERTVAAVVREVLGTDRVGLHERFFELGADSVGLVQILAKLQQLLNRQLAITCLFAHPTVAALAAYLQGDPPPKDSIEKGTRRVNACRRERRRTGEVEEK
jgi:epothilone synthetase B